MRRLSVAFVFSGILLGGVSCAREAERAPAPAADRGAVIAAARTLIARTPFATLSTIGEDGAPQSRIVEPFPVEDNFTVTVLYFDQQGPGYVSLIGSAAVVRDPAEKAKRWKESWVAFYKDRNRGEDYALIRVTPTRLEISSPSQGMNNDQATWQPVTIVIGKDE